MTPFWHRRVCEATVLINAIILGLYVWINVSGNNQLEAGFTVSLTAVVFSSVSLIIAGLSYIVIPENRYPIRVISALIAYILLLVSVGLLTIQTGTSNSPFLALWMVSSVFSGMFGIGLIGLLFTGLTGYTIWVGLEGQFDSGLILGVALAGYLPLLVSFVLWHGKSRSEKMKEQSYSDLANQLDRVANKSDTVINAIKDGVIAIDSHGIIELINPAAQQLAGWGNQDAVGLDYKSVLQLTKSDGSEVDKSSDPAFEVLTTNKPVKRNDLLLQKSSGKKINIGVVASPIGRIGAGAIIVFHDITSERAEEKAQAEFISTASHEMRTPVASIEGYLGLALNPSTATIDEKARDFITKAHEAAGHLGRLFQDLLDITKSDDGRLSNNPKVIDVVQFTHDVVGGLEHKAVEKNLHLFFKPLTDDVGGVKNLEPAYFVNADADHMREVVANLVENAIKYTKQGEIIIDVLGDDYHVIVSVTDSGIGIPAEDIPHLFQKFYRVDSSDTREIGGTGLGLYLCRRLVEAMEGRIWVESEKGVGSKFSIEIPRISNSEAQQLIELSENEVKPNEKYLTDPSKVDIETQKHRQQALATPIILGKKESATHRPPPVSQIPMPMPMPTPVLAQQPEPQPASAPQPVISPAVSPNPPAQPSTSQSSAQPQNLPTSSIVVPPPRQTAPTVEVRHEDFTDDGSIALDRRELDIPKRQ